MKPIRFTEYELMLAHYALQQHYHNNGGGRRWPDMDKADREFHEAMESALKKMEEANGKPFGPAMA